jgi:predicted RNase H-like HicB family nuclease
MTTQIQIIPPRVPLASVVREDEATDGTKLYLAEVPDLPGCMSHGETPEEALQNLQEAIELYLKALDDAGVERPVVKHPPMTSGTSLTGGSTVLVQARNDIEGEMTMELRR